MLLVVVAAVAAIGALGAFLSSLPTPPQGRYSAQLHVDGYRANVTYEGQTATHAYFLIVNVTLRNNGTLALDPSSSDWDIADINGVFVASPVTGFYTVPSVSAGQGVHATLVFDLYGFDQPAKVILSLPDGNEVAALL